MLSRFWSLVALNLTAEIGVTSIIWCNHCLLPVSFSLLGPVRTTRLLFGREDAIWSLTHRTSAFRLDGDTRGHDRGPPVDRLSLRGEREGNVPALTHRCTMLPKPV